MKVMTKQILFIATVIATVLLLMACEASDYDISQVNAGQEPENNLIIINEVYYQVLASKIALYIGLFLNLYLLANIIAIPSKMKRAQQEFKGFKDCISVDIVKNGDCSIDERDFEIYQAYRSRMETEQRLYKNTQVFNIIMCVYLLVTGYQYIFNYFSSNTIIASIVAIAIIVIIVRRKYYENLCLMIMFLVCLLLVLAQFYSGSIIHGYMQH